MKRMSFMPKCFVFLVTIIAIQLFLGGCSSDDGRISESSKTNKSEKLIKVDDVEEMTMTDAMRKLEAHGFSNVSTNVESSQYDNVIVIEQNPKAGSKVSKDTLIELVCVPAFNLYIDVKSDDNLFLSTYDIDVYIDNDKIGTVSDGKELYTSLLLGEGSHTLLVCKSEDDSLQSKATISLNCDSTFSCSVSHGSKAVKIYSEKTIPNVLWSKMKVPQITGIRLSDAMIILKDAGFNNINETPSNIWTEKDWVVVSQKPQVDKAIDIHDEVTIECKSLEDYYSEQYTGKNLNETGNYRIDGITENYKKTEDGNDITTLIEELSEERTALWKVDKAEYKSGKVTVFLTYLGSEEERNLEAIFPKENAQQAIVVAMTNTFCPDVLTDDGNHYDPQKFHGIAYSGVYKYTVKRPGDWSYAGEATWKVSDMHLYLEFYDREIKINCTVTLDGNEYSIDDVIYVSAKPKYIDSDDPTKTSTNVLTKEYNPQLTLDSSLVTGSGGMNSAGEIEKKEVEDKLFQEWVGDQFSPWDGSHKALTTLIKKSLNDEKSYKHIKTIYYTVTTDELLNSFQKQLSSWGFSYTLKQYDMIVVCEFSAKNIYNATVKAEAIGVASFSTGTISLLGIN